MKRFAVNNFKKKKDDELLVLVRTIIDAMGSPVGLTYYATPDPALADVETALDDFQAKLAASRRRGSPSETSAKDDSREVLEDLMRRLTFYVNNVALGNLTTLLNSGFELNQLKATGMPPDVPQRLRLSQGPQKLQLRVDFDKVARATGYEYRYTSVLDADKQPVWDERYYTSSSVKNIIAPLVEGVKYYVQVRALNRHGASDWSYVLDYLGR